MPSKGKPAHIRAGMTDKKTKGPLMLALAYQFRNHPIIGTVPVVPTITTPPLFIQPPKSVSFQNEISKVDHITITKQWLFDWCSCIPSIQRSEL